MSVSVGDTTLISQTSVCNVADGISYDRSSRRMDKLKKVIYGNKCVSEQILKQLSTKLTEETTNTSVINDLTKLLPAVFKYAVHDEKKLRDAALPALAELAGLLDLNKHLKEQPWWTEMKAAILDSVDVLMNLVSMGDDMWAELWKTTVMMLGSDLRAELTLLNRLLKVVEKAFKMTSEEVRHQGFECWCKLIDNFSINKHEINNKRRLGLLVIPLKANNHSTPRLCASKMKTWKHLLSKLDQHNEMTVQLLVTHFLEFMFRGVGSIAPACKTLNTECANMFSQMLQNPLLYRILPQLFIKHTFVCIEHIHRDSSLCLTIWERLLENMKNNQWTEGHVLELMTNLTNASKTDKLGRSKTFAHMVRTLYCGNLPLPGDLLVKHLKTIMSVALEPHVLVNYAEDWYNELLNIVSETDPIQLPQNIIGDIISKLNGLAVSELFRDEKLKFLRGMWITMTNIITKWMGDDGQIGKNDNAETDLQNIHDLLFFGAAALSSTWNKLQMKSWKSLYSECVKYFSLSTEVKCEKFVGDLVNLLLEGVNDKKIPLHITLDLVSIVLEFHLSKDASSILPLMMEVAVSTMSSFHNDTAGAFALLSQYLKMLVIAARGEPALVNDILTVVEKMLKSLDDIPLADAYLEKPRNVIMKAQIQLHGLKPSRSQDKCESPGTNNAPAATSPSMTSFMHRLAKSKETKSKISSPTPSQSSDVSSPIHTPTSKKSASPFCDMKSEDFVFVPPKPRKIFLTEHQKESMTTRKHDIPALYQDLSQDSSLSAFESIMTPGLAVDKEQKIEKGGMLHSPQSFEDLNFKSLPSRKSPAANIRSSTSEDKLQNNKENDGFNNNTKCQVKTISKEAKGSVVNEEIPLKVLQEDQKKVLDHTPENVDVSKITPTITHLSSRKSLNSNSTSIQSNGIEDVKNDVLDSDNTQIDQDKASTDSSNNTKRLQDSAQNVTTPKNITPKRSLRKTKLSISIEKSGKRNGVRNKRKEEEIENNDSALSLPNSANKTPNLITTPKVSPRRLRKRKSGLTPILSGGEIVNNVKRKSSSKDTPTNKNSLNNDTCVRDAQGATEECNETIKYADEELKNNKDNVKSKLNIISDHSQSSCKNKADQVKIPSDTSEESSTPKTVKSTEKHTRADPENLVDDDDIEIVAVIEKNKHSVNVKGNEDQNTSCNAYNRVALKNPLSHKSGVGSIDLTCSPMKVVVERLPEITMFDCEVKELYTGESINEIGNVKNKTTPVKNIMASLSASNHNINSSSLNVSRSENLESKAISRKEKDNISTFELKFDETHREKTLQLERDSNDIIISNEASTLSVEIGSKKLTSKVQLESSNLESLKKTSSKDTSKTKLNYENCNGKTNSIDEIVNLTSLEGKTPDEDTTDIKTSSVEKTSKTSASKISESNNSPSPSFKVKSTESSPVKSGQKPLTPKTSASKISGSNDSPSTSYKVKSTESSPVKSGQKPLTPKTSASKISGSNDSPSTSFKVKSTESTPVKSGQKQLKQTQLNFTPIRKSEVTAEDLDTKLSQLEEIDRKSPLLVITKMGETEINKALQNTKCTSEHKVITNNKTVCLDSNKHDIESEGRETVECKERDDILLTNNVEEKTGQEEQRTPEKENTCTNIEICLQKTEIEVRVTDSPNKICDSEDIIASSQETDVTAPSILVSCRTLSSSNSSKLLSKSPKKCENSFPSSNSSERDLKSSSAKTENSRFTLTPVKKSVCRRLDVEIIESPESNEVNCPSTSSTEAKPSADQQYEEELSDDFKTLNGDNGSQKITENHSLPSSRELESCNNLEDAQSDSGNCSPRSLKSPNRRRLVVEIDASSTGSPKRTMGSLRFESNSSPISSPNSRTSQMMELAKQEAEKTFSSSPVSSTKKRRILPIRIGSVKTPVRQVIQRTHNGPSAEWVRRTYSPTASPNSSILKRNYQQTSQLVSPDCSPPSSKKKRVSFLDPPVSESLLFSKANPGTGQIHRPEPKQDEVMELESEDFLTQGSVGVEVPQISNSEASVFSPLKQCSNPLADIMERIVNLQWMSELEAQLGRLGVTTVGELSSLPEETVERLPFIPPKLERLRKILQNYYSEINEKPVDNKPTCCEASQEVCLSPGKDSSNVETETLSPKKTVEESEPQSEEIARIESPGEDIASVAEDIKQKLEQYPDLIRELGDMLHVDVVMKLLNFAVCKLKKDNDKS